MQHDGGRKYGISPAEDPEEKLCIDTSEENASNMLVKIQQHAQSVLQIEEEQSYRNTNKEKCYPGRLKASTASVGVSTSLFDGTPSFFRRSKKF